MAELSRITTADVDSVVGWTVIRAAREAKRVLTSVLRKHNLTPVEFGVLAQLAAAHGTLTQADVARLTEIRPQSVAPIIDGLSDRNLLTREGVRGRGRSGRLTLTVDGAQVLGAAFPDVVATNQAFAATPTGMTIVNDELLTFLSRSKEV